MVLDSNVLLIYYFELKKTIPSIHENSFSTSSHFRPKTIDKSLSIYLQIIDKKFVSPLQ